MGILNTTIRLMTIPTIGKQWEFRPQHIYTLEHWVFYHPQISGLLWPGLPQGLLSCPISSSNGIVRWYLSCHLSDYYGIKKKTTCTLLTTFICLCSKPRSTQWDECIFPYMNGENSYGFHGSVNIPFVPN